MLVPITLDDYSSTPVLTDGRTLLYRTQINCEIKLVLAAASC